MLSELGWVAVDTEFVAADFHRECDGFGLPAVWQRHLAHELVEPHVRVVEDFGIGVDRRARHAAAVELGEPLGFGAFGEHRLQDCFERFLVLRAQRVGFETRIGFELRHADRFAHVVPKLVVACGDHEWRIARLIALVRCGARMGGTQSPRRLAGAEVFARLQRGDAEQPGEH